MNWIVFAIVAWIALGMEVGLTGALQLGGGSGSLFGGEVVPSFVLVLLVHIALWARLADVLRSAMVLGLALDLIQVVPTGTSEDAIALGPMTLGCLAAGLLVHRVRSVLFRESPITLAWMTLGASGIVFGVSLLILALRAQYDDIQLGSFWSELGVRAASSLYSAVIALPMGLVLTRLTPWLGIRSGHVLVPGRRG